MRNAARQVPGTCWLLLLLCYVSVSPHRTSGEFIPGLHQLVAAAQPFVKEAGERYGVPVQDRLPVLYLDSRGKRLTRSPHEMIYKSITLMLHHVAPYTPLDIYIFMHNAPADPRHHAYSVLSPNIAVMPILDEHWHRRYRDAYMMDSKLPVTDYHIMGQWRLEVPFTFLALLGYEWAWQVDDDSWIWSPLDHNLLTRLRRGKYLLAAERVMQDRPFYFAGLPELARSFIIMHQNPPHDQAQPDNQRQHRQQQQQQQQQQESVQPFWPANTLWLHCNPPDLMGLHSTINFTLGFDNSYVFGNCFMMNLRLWMNPLVQEFIQLALVSGGVYRYRWNEQSVNSFIWMMFVEPSQFLLLHDINYSHVKPGPSIKQWQDLLQGTNLTSFDEPYRPPWPLLLSGLGCTALGLMVFWFRRTFAKLPWRPNG